MNGLKQIPDPVFLGHAIETKVSNVCLNHSTAPQEKSIGRKTGFSGFENRGCDTGGPSMKDHWRDDPA
ncbi:MAG: hypothetical protein WD397_10270 [Wenzhouxiangellaceae bacterium]